MWHAARSTPARPSPWLLALLLIGAGYGIAVYRSLGLALERGWFLPLMVLASVANLSLTLLLLREAGAGRRYGWHRCFWRILRWCLPCNGSRASGQDAVIALAGAEPHSRRRRRVCARCLAVGRRNATASVKPIGG
ncbi:MAG: hypothetical protein MZV49_27250 [Rhodopseudomonas palustris]|nr:hypothetical protein [Rhodopseudomonas palustris]